MYSVGHLHSFWEHRASTVDLHRTLCLAVLFAPGWVLLSSSSMTKLRLQDCFGRHNKPHWNVFFLLCSFMTHTVKYAPEEKFHSLDRKIFLDSVTSWRQEDFLALRELRTQGRWRWVIIKLICFEFSINILKLFKKMICYWHTKPWNPVNLATDRSPTAQQWVVLKGVLINRMSSNCMSFCLAKKSKKSGFSRRLPPDEVAIFTRWLQDGVPGGCGGLPYKRDGGDCRGTL